MLRWSRMHLKSPMPLVYLMRVLFRNVHGVYRLLTCPVYGLTETELRDECRNLVNIKRALSTFLNEGAYQYAGIGFVLGDALRQRVHEELEHVNDGVGARVVAGVMDWIHCVQLQPLQDHAMCQPMQFMKAWTTTDYDDWEKSNEHWCAALRTREECDLRWVLASFTPSWNPGVAALQLKMLETVEQIRETLGVEDANQWEACSRDFTKEQVPRLAHDCPAMIQRMSTLEYVGPPFGDTGSTGVATDTASRLVLSPTSTDFLTLSQFKNTAHSDPNMNPSVSTFSQVPSFRQWEKGQDDLSVRTPYRGESIVTGQRSGTEEIPERGSLVPESHRELQRGGEFGGSVTVGFFV